MPNTKKASVYVTGVMGRQQICPKGNTVCRYPNVCLRLGHLYANGNSPRQASWTIRDRGRDRSRRHGRCLQGARSKIDRIVAIKTILLHQSAVQEQRENFANDFSSRLRPPVDCYIPASLPFSM